MNHLITTLFPWRGRHGRPSDPRPDTTLPFYLDLGSALHPVTTVEFEHWVGIKPGHDILLSCSQSVIRKDCTSYPWCIAAGFEWI